jgi:hypothetical protein
MPPPETIPVLNTTAEIIPGFGLMRRTGVNNDGQITVAKPNADGQLCLVNSPFPILPNKVGMSAGYHLRAVIAYDQQDGAPANGETWGATSGSWLARKNNAGFQIDGGAFQGVVNAVRVPAVVNQWLNSNGSFHLSNGSYPANTWVAFGSGLVLPGAGTYNIYYNCYGYYNVAGSIGTAKWEARFSSSVLGGVVPGSESVIVMPQVANQYIYGSSAKYMRYFATASDTITVEMMQTVLGQLTTPLLHHRTMGYDKIG